MARFTTEGSAANLVNSIHILPSSPSIRFAFVNFNDILAEAENPRILEEEIVFRNFALPLGKQRLLWAKNMLSGAGTLLLQARDPPGLEGLAGRDSDAGGGAGARIDWGLHSVRALAEG